MTLAAIAVLVVPAQAGATTFPVTTTADTNDGVCDSDCSLREAINAANDTGGFDTIRLPAGTYTLSIPGGTENDGNTGDLDINDGVEIIGASARTTIISAGAPGAGVDRVFDIGPLNPGAEAEMAHVTITGGKATAANDDFGGAIENAGTLYLSYVSVRSNTAASDGGAISNDGTLHIVSSLLADNRAGHDGGALWSAGTLTAQDVTAVANSAAGAGGGLAVAAGGANLKNDTIAANSAASGGAIFNDASVTVANTIVATDAGATCAGTAPVTSAGHNIDNRTACGFGGPGDRSGVDALLAPGLADNGGETDTLGFQTRAPDIGGPCTVQCPAPSPAIDAGDPASCPTGDARDVFTQGPACDIGAFELRQADIEVGLTPPTAIGIIGGIASYLLTVNDNGQSSVGGVRVTIAYPPGLGFSTQGPCVAQGDGGAGGVAVCDFWPLSNGGIGARVSKQLNFAVRGPQPANLTISAAAQITTPRSPIDATYDARPDNNRLSVITRVLSPPVDRRPPAARLTLKRAHGLRRALVGGIAATIVSDERGSAIATARLSAGQARALGLGRRAVVVATGRVALRAGKHTRITLRFTARARQRLSHAHRVSLQISAAVRDLAANQTKLTRSTTLRRP